MKRVAIVVKCHDHERGEALMAHARAAGHDPVLRVVDSFPIADPLAALFASVRSRFDVLIILVSRPLRQVQWLLLELLTQRHLGALAHETVLPFAILMEGTQPIEKMQADPESCIIVTNLAEAASAMLDRIQH